MCRLSAAAVNDTVTVTMMAQCRCSDSNGDGTVTVTFEGRLQGAPTVNGPWADVEGAVSPQVIPVNQAMQFGRAVK